MIMFILAIFLSKHQALGKAAIDLAYMKYGIVLVFLYPGNI